MQGLVSWSGKKWLFAEYFYSIFKFLLGGSKLDLS